jgi:hypothetical protein
MRAPHALATVAILVLLGPGVADLAAQQTRDEMIRTAQRAYDDFETTRARDLLERALEPALGPQDSVWATGLQLLTQILIEEGSGPLAEVWSRWGVRLAPGMRVDSVTFLPEVVRSFGTARVAVGSETLDDSITTTTFEWDAPGTPVGRGRLRIRPSTLAAPLRASVDGIGDVDAGGSLTVAPGSYTIEATAEGFEPARVTREVLPSVTTVLGFDLAPLVVAVADTVAPAPVIPTPQPTPPAPEAAPKGGKFPIAVVVLGVLGAAGAAAALALGGGGGGNGGGGTPPTTGGIIITIPNP